MNDFVKARCDVINSGESLVEWRALETAEVQRYQLISIMRKRLCGNRREMWLSLLIFTFCSSETIHTICHVGRTSSLYDIGKPRIKLNEYLLQILVSSFYNIWYYIWGALNSEFQLTNEGTRKRIFAFHNIAQCSLKHTKCAEQL